MPSRRPSARGSGPEDGKELRGKAWSPRNTVQTPRPPRWVPFLPRKSRAPRRPKSAAWAACRRWHRGVVGRVGQGLPVGVVTLGIDYWPSRGPRWPTRPINSVARRSGERPEQRQSGPCSVDGPVWDVCELQARRPAEVSLRAGGRSGRAVAQGRRNGLPGPLRAKVAMCACTCIARCTHWSLLWYSYRPKRPNVM